MIYVKLISIKFYQLFLSLLPSVNRLQQKYKIDNTQVTKVSFSYTPWSDKFGLDKGMLKTKEHKKFFNT